MKKETTGKHKNERNTNQPTQKKNHLKKKKQINLGDFFCFYMNEWNHAKKPNKKNYLKKNMKKKYNHAQFNLQVKGGKETEWQTEQEREREGGGVWLETIQ